MAKQNGIIKKTFLPKAYKQQMNSLGGQGIGKDSSLCPFPVIPQSKRERADYAMIEESLLEYERRGRFIRVYPNEQHVQHYRNFFEEERANDNLLYNYVFNQVNFEAYYKNQGKY